MNFKNIKDFSLSDCQAYLENNPIGEERDAIYGRMLELKSQSTEQKHLENKYRDEQPFKGNNTRWIDFLQFKAECKLRDLNFLRIFIYVVIVPFIFLALGAIYYSNTDHKIVGGSWEQSEYTSGIEHLLLEMYVIEPPDFSNDDNYPRYWSYSVYGGFLIFTTIYIPSILLLLLLINCFDSSKEIKRIYDIEDNGEAYRRTRSLAGNYGLSKLKKYRLVQVLPIIYDNIYSCGPDSYICVMNNKMGVYNTGKRKMVIDVVYDKITALQGNALEVVKDGVVSRFTHEGYRVVV